MSDSDSSVSSRRRRQTIGRLPAPTTKTGLTKGRTSDVGASQNTRSTTSGMDFKKDSKGKGRTIHSTFNPDSSWKAQIDALRAEVALDHELFADSIFHADDDEEDDLIRVIVRKRPFSADKPSDIDVIHPLEYGLYGKMLVYQPNTRVDLTKEINTIPFAFDGVFGEQYNNLQIYEKSVRNLIPVVLDGQHATVFAFGCTGSGVSILCFVISHSPTTELCN
jgi:Kinesin motor domain